MKTVNEIVDAIGHSNLSRALQVNDTAVSNAKRRGVFPAGWRDVVAALCHGNGIKCDAALFRSKPVDPSLLVFRTPSEKGTAE